MINFTSLLFKEEKELEEKILKKDFFGKKNHNFVLCLHTQMESKKGKLIDTAT
jgi:hypothetical protein